MTDFRSLRRNPMYKPLILAGVVGALVLAGAAQASDGPTSGEVARASQECRTERGTTSATREAFAARYGTNHNHRNAFGKCVSQKSRQEMKERQKAEKRASQTCKTERGTTAATRDAFEQKYGTGEHKHNAFGKCVSKLAKA